VDRPQQARMTIDEGDGLALVPDMVAGADDVDTGGVELVADLLGDAEPSGGVLAVDDDEVEPELASQARHMLQHDVAPGAPNDIAAEEQAHGTIRSGSLRARRSGSLRARSRSNRAAGRRRHAARPALPRRQR